MSIVLSKDDVDILSQLLYHDLDPPRVTYTCDIYYPNHKRSTQLKWEADQEEKKELRLEKFKELVYRLQKEAAHVTEQVRTDK